MFITQATVSKHIQSLEKGLDTQLFSREHRQITLTEAGQLALPLAQKIIADEQQLLTQLQQHKKDEQLTLNIRAIPSISRYQVFNLMPAFQKAYPKINLTFAEDEDQGLINALDQKRADIIFLRLFTPLPDQYEVLLSATDQFVVVLPKTHPLAQKETINITELKNDPFLLLDELTQLYDPILAMAQQAGFSPKISYKGKRIDLILDMINRNMGVSIMMEKSMDLYDFPSVVMRPLEETVTSTLAFVKRKDHHTTATQLFWDFCRQHQPQDNPITGA